MERRASIQTLPNELLICITEKLSIPDLKAFRLASRFFKPIIDPFLFSAVTFSEQEDHKRSFEMICNHPYYRDFVTELRYSVTRIVSIQCKHSFKELLAASEIHHELDKLYEEYNNASKSAADLSCSELASWLGNGLNLLPNIQHISIVKDSEQAGWYRRFPFLLSGYKRWSPYMSCFLYWDHQPILEEGMALKDFQVINQAISSSGIIIQKFSTYERSDTGVLDWRKTPLLKWDCKGDNWIEDNKVIVEIAYLFKGLVHLSLALNGYENRLEPLHELLKECRVLKQLDLDWRTVYHDLKWRDGTWRDTIDKLKVAFVPKMSDGSTQNEHYDIGKSIVIPSLEKLSLSNLSTSGPMLTHILKSHKIKTLSLHNIYDYGSSSTTLKEDWELALDTIRSMRLSSVTLRNVSGFIRNTSGTPIDLPITLSHEELTSLDVNDPRVLEVWSALPRPTKFMPERVKEFDIAHVCSSIVHTLDHRRQALRERIMADQAQLDPLIMEYAKGQSIHNPLTSLSLYASVYWFESYFLRPGLLDKFETK